MRKLTGITLLAAGLLAFAAGAADSGALTSSPGATERGKQLYMKHICYSCHGTVGQGGGKAGPKLAPQPFPYDAFENQMRDPRNVMPRYPEKFVSSQDLADIYAYLASIPAGTKAGDIPLLKK